MSEPTPSFLYEGPSKRGKAGVIIAALVLLAAANVYLRQPRCKRSSMQNSRR
jgi:hypothetical protein